MNIIPLINQFFELSNKLQIDHSDQYERNIQRIYNFFENNDYVIKNPLNEAYSESRTDIEASLTGSKTTSLVISQVIKPIIYKKLDGQLTLVQKGIVIVS